MCLRVWDIYLLDGERVVTAMAYTILRLHKNKLLKLNDMDLIVQYLQVSDLFFTKRHTTCYTHLLLSTGSKKFRGMLTCGLISSGAVSNLLQYKWIHCYVVCSKIPYDFVPFIRHSHIHRNPFFAPFCIVQCPMSSMSLR